MPTHGKDWTIKEIVAQFKLVNYKEELGHELRMNAGFQDLERRAESKYQTKYYIGQKVYADGKRTTVLSIEAKSDSDSKDLIGVSVTDDMPGPSHYGNKTPVPYKVLQTEEEFKISQLKLAQEIIERYK